MSTANFRVAKFAVGGFSVRLIFPINTIPRKFFETLSVIEETQLLFSQLKKKNEAKRYLSVEFCVSLGWKTRVEINWDENKKNLSRDAMTLLLVGGNDF